jgi:predicted acetyltransferase
MAKIAAAPTSFPTRANVRVDLRLPSEAAQTQFAQMLAEIQTAGERHHHGAFSVALGSFSKYVNLLLAFRQRLNLDGDLKPIDTYFIYSQSILVGEVRIRHELPPEVEDLGGHITLYVRPSARRRGIATASLELALEKARERGLRTMLLGCLSSNLAAKRVIEHNKGIRINDVETPLGVFLRYRFFK